MFELIGLGVAVLIGAGTQRVTGLGFALVTAPYVVLLLGPFNGVRLVNASGAVTAACVLTQVWRDVELRNAALLLGPAVLAVLPGAWTVRHLPAPVLAVFVGGLILVALGAVVATEKARVLRGRTGALIAGAGSGFMNVTAGAGGPAITVYAVSTGWPQRGFAATTQLVFGVLSVLSLIAKGGPPSLAAADWSVVAAGLVTGILVGNALSGRVPARHARHAVIALAMTGAAVTLGKGVVQLA